jgi:hypothetical protein
MVELFVYRNRKLPVRKIKKKRVNNLDDSEPIFINCDVLRRLKCLCLATPLVFNTNKQRSSLPSHVRVTRVFLKPRENSAETRRSFLIIAGHRDDG